jgi:mycothiol synthase
MKMTQLLMRRPAGAAALAESAGAAARPARADDADDLARLLGAAFPEMSWDAARAEKDLLKAPDVPVTFVVEEGARLVATASVRYVPRFPESGYVHWVGVDPMARGRRLGTEVMAAVVRRFAEDGRDSAVLETDDFRLPAIASYLGQGFVPQYPEPDHEVRWSLIFEQLAAHRRTSRRT